MVFENQQDQGIRACCTPRSKLYFLPVAIIFSGAHLALGYFSGGIALLGALAVLILWFITIPLGLKLRHRIPEQHLRRLMHGCLIVLSVPRFL